MDVEALRRLQHRMEARGRACEGCRVYGDPSKAQCACNPQQSRNEGDEGPAVVAAEREGKDGAPESSKGPTSTAVRLWLLERLENVDVDITGGATEQIKNITRCCGCCDGSQDGCHISKPVVESCGNCVDGRHDKEEAPVSTETADDPPAVESRAAYYAQLADRCIATGAAYEDALKYGPLTACTQATGSPGDVINVTKSSKLLSAILKNAELLASKPQEVINHMKSPECDLSMLANNAPSAKESAWAIFNERKRASGGSKASADSEISPSSTQRSRTTPSVHYDTPHLRVSDTVAEIDCQPPSVAVFPHPNRVVPDDVGALLSRVVRGGTTPELHSLEQAVRQPVQRTQSVTSTGTQKPFLLSTAIQTEDLATNPHGALKENDELRVEETVHQQGAQNAKAGSQTGSEVLQSPGREEKGTQHVPSGNNGLSDPSVKEPCTVKPPTPVVTAPADLQPTPVPSNTQAETATPSAELTPSDIINALREKLLLEKADAYVRLLEQQVTGGIQKQARIEEEEAHMRSQSQERILSLLARLHQEDLEVMEALYDTVTIQDEEGRSYEQDAPTLLVPLPPVSTPLPSAPQLSSSVIQPSVEASVKPVGNKLAFPSEVMAAYERCAEDFSLHSNAAGQGKSLTSLELPPTGAPRGSMKAWVDKYFSDSLDPQHRELLQHVLLSREAEIRRADAAEMQFMKLKSKLPSTDAPSSACAAESIRDASGRFLNFSGALADTEEKSKSFSLNRPESENMPKVIKSSVKPMTSGLEELSGLNNEQTHANTKTTASTTAASAINEEEMQHWKNRCSLIEQQHRVSVQRLSELQAYIEQLRRDAQQAAVKVANSSSAPTPAAPAVSAAVPLQTNFSSVHMSSIRDAWSNGNIATPTCQSDTLSFTQPPSSSCCADPSPIGVTSLPAQQAVGKQYGDAGPAPQHVIVPDTLPNLGVAVTPTSGVDRATALQKLREDLDEECARFVSESERWKKFLQTQRCAIGSEAVGVSGLL